MQKSLLESYVEIVKQRSFSTAYRTTFRLLRADTMALKHKAYRLRFEVYADENGFEWTHPDQYLETDSYDDRSVHYILQHRVSGETVGTVRVVLPDENKPEASLPIQETCEHPLLHDGSRVQSLCEISRFCTAARFRSRRGDGRFLSAYSDQDITGGYVQDKVVFARRTIPYAPAALLQGAFESALRARITDCVLMVEPDHLPSLQKLGFAYNLLGPEIIHHGGMQPLIFNIKHVLDNMRRVAPHCWDIVSDDGRLQDMADRLDQNDWKDRVLEEV
ncbi:MAG: PEP-CTERM/exosortase system-associated acyltransferase [Alphaproteobacteria bacterium]|nr:PEP-CTERM/exosortase system-associated acyltransferase [Alphaproteobacteria bacterium]